MDVLSRIKPINDLPLEGRRVFIRADLDCPMTADGFVADDARIQSALPAIRHAIAQGAKVVLASTLGRPRGKRVPELSLAPVGERLAELLDQDVYMPADTVGDGPRKVVMERVDGEVVLLENLAFNPEEEANDDVFAQRLASLADIYVNDAFASVNRAHASVDAITRHLPVRGAGPLLARELQFMQKVATGTDCPFVLLVGGSSLTDKTGLFNRMMARTRSMCIGGALAATFLKAQGRAVGRTRIEADKIETATGIVARAKVRGVEILLPTDVVVAAEANEKALPTVVPVDEIPEDAMILDIGPATVVEFSARVGTAKMILWNGPMGMFELRPFLAGTEALAKAVSRSRAVSVAVGQDTAAAIHRAMMTPFFAHVSAGGRAALDYLEGRELPGVEALRKGD